MDRNSFERAIFRQSAIAKNLAKHKGLVVFYMPVLVTQSFGNEKEYRRAIFAIWSYWTHFSVEGKVLLFTDYPDYFTPYFGKQPVEYVTLTPARILEMRGEVDFLHRMKIAIIEQAFQSTDDSILYLDSDAFFVKNPIENILQLSPSVSFMHLKEYKFESLRKMLLPAGATFHAFLNLIEGQKFRLAEGIQLQVLPNQESWNAGAIFLHQSHASLIPDVYALTDQFYASTNNHASEQYAFSIVLQNETTVNPCHDKVYHYWYRVKKQVADNFLEKNILKLHVGSAEEKMTVCREWTLSLPKAFDNHVWILRDKSMQGFNENRFGVGYKFAAKAIIKNPFALSFIKDLLYHSKRFFSNRGGAYD